MLGWIYRALIGRFWMCRHHYETVQTGAITNAKGGNMGFYWATQCKHCGEMKFFEKR